METNFLEEYRNKRKQLDENYKKKRIELENNYETDIQKLDEELAINMKKWNEEKNQIIDSLDKLELKPKGNLKDLSSFNSSLSQGLNLYNNPNSNNVHHIIFADQNANSKNGMYYPIKIHLDEEEINQPKQNDNNSNEPKESSQNKSE